MSPLRGTLGSAIAQAVSRRLPTLAAGVGAQVSSCGICGGQSSTRVVHRFPLPIFIPLTAPAYIIRAWYNRPISGRRTEWTQSHLTPISKTEKRKGTDYTLCS
jgi:hypothetical protein